MKWLGVFLWFVLPLLPCSAGFADGNRLLYLDAYADPYWVGLGTPRLVTPQWVGDEGVDAVVVLAIDDMSDADRYEEYLRPILDRLKRIDGRAPVSIMTKSIDPQAPQLRRWLDEGVSIEAHTDRHPCPCLRHGNLPEAKAAFDRCVDSLATAPHAQPVAFRMPCCDSMNSVSPRFFREVFNRTTPAGRFLTLDSSVFLLYTAADPHLPRDLVLDSTGRERFRKYVPADRLMVNYVQNYPYPYVIGRSCWEFPCVMPSDWNGQHRNGPCHEQTVVDLKAAIDATVLKSGVFSLCFHPHGWIAAEQVVELIDYANGKYGARLKFLTFREVQRRIDQHLLEGHPLRRACGSENGVRLLDVNNDSFMDVVIGNEAVCKTRIWQPADRRWISRAFPVQLVTGQETRETSTHMKRADVPSVNSETSVDTGVHFGILQNSGCASLLVRNESAAGLWHFTENTWNQDPRGLAGLNMEGPLFTQRAGRDQGVRLIDLDQDDICELVVAGSGQSAVFAWKAGQWNRLPYTLPNGLVIVDAQGNDAGLRFVDFDEDGSPDIVFSNADRYAAYVFTSIDEGWTRKMMDAPRGGQPNELPKIVRADGSDNGVWFSQRHMWVQNEDTGGQLPDHVDRRDFTTDLLASEKEPPPRSPQSSWKSLIPRSGYRVELMACEPLVMDPIDFAWSADGKLWVVEMADYPLGIDDRGQPGGRIRVLEDSDADGRYDRSTVFLDSVPFPTGVMPWRNGVLVTAAPTVFFAEDTDGDGRADLRKTLFDGFHEGNQQHRVNHPRWGLDNWIHVANGDSDGLIRSLRTGQTVDISGRDLRFRPDQGLLDPATGRAQYGRNRDDWGNWFGCNNSNPGWHYVLVDHYLRRNPHFAPPSGRLDLTQFRDVFPAGRVMTHCFYDQPTPPEGQPGRWTSLAGAMIYRDCLLGRQVSGNYFVADSVYNVIHRLVLEYDGIHIRGRRAAGEQRSEFLASADPWFRPTTVRTGPDGALWVADMYRYVIEHPQWIDKRLQASLPLRRGHDRGRVYRIYPVDRTPRPIPRLDQLATKELVAALDSPNGWQRDTAHQLLLWRNERSAVALLETMVADYQRPTARLHALCVLEGLGAVQPAMILRGMQDRHPGVRRHAVRIGEALLVEHAEIGVAMLQLLGDTDAAVRLQTTYSLGAWHDPRAGRALAEQAMRHAGNPYMTAAVLSSATAHVQTMIAHLRERNADQKLLGQLTQLANDVEAGTVSVADTVTRSAPARDGEAVIMGQTKPERRAALDRYADAARVKGDPTRGKQVFVDATCSICHRLEDIGEHIGPDIRTLLDRSPQNLLTAIVDPNQAVKERFVNYVAVTLRGRVHTGMLMDQTGNSATLADNKGNKIVILRRDLEELVPTSQSFMGEGLESSLSLQQMADLLAFVSRAGLPRRHLPGNEPFTLLTSQEGDLELPTRQAEIYGPEIQFDPHAECIKQWNDGQSYLVWTIHLQRAQTFDLWADWASESATAGQLALIEVGSHAIPVTVPDTGGDDVYRWDRLGRLRLEAGVHRLGFRSEGPLTGPLVNLRRLKLALPGKPPEHVQPEPAEPGISDSAISK